MNYRTHISVPSSNRVEVTVAGHPELDRLVELPSDAPREFLAYAYLLSIGVDADAHQLDDLEPPVSWDYNDWDRFLGPRATYPPVSGERMRLPGLPASMEVRLEQREDFRPQVGDQKVAVHATEHMRSPVRSAGAWQVTPPPFHTDAVNRELARKYGVVLPHFNSSVLDPHRYGWGPTPLIDSLLADLSPVRRIALQAHIDEIGLLDGAKYPGDIEIHETAEPLLRLLAAVGPDGAPQDPESGWFSEGFVAELASGLGWESGETADAAPGDLLISIARRARLIRRLRGSVVPTAAARKLATDPAREVVKVLSVATSVDGCERYSNRCLSPRSAMAAALLAIADGSAHTFDDLVGLVELAEPARQRRRDDEYDDEYAWHYPEDESGRARSISLAVDSVVEGFSVLSAPGAFGDISSAMRAVARAMLI